MQMQNLGDEFISLWDDIKSNKLILIPVFILDFLCIRPFNDGTNDYTPFVKYYLVIILKAYNEFESRVEHLKNRAMSKPDRIRYIIDQNLGKIMKKEIMEKCPDISKVTVERTLTELVKNGYPIKIGADPAAAYAKDNTMPR